MRRLTEFVSQSIWEKKNKKKTNKIFLVQMESLFSRSFQQLDLENFLGAVLRELQVVDACVH